MSINWRFTNELPFWNAQMCLQSPCTVFIEINKNTQIYKSTFSISKMYISRVSKMLPTEPYHLARSTAFES